MATPDLGLILTHTTSLATLRQALDALGPGAWLKIVPAWCPFRPQELAGLGRRLVVRTSWGDPSYAGGARAYPTIDVLAELWPWLETVPDAVIELGNEPSGHGLDLARYARDLAAAVAACRTSFPRATILPPAHSPHAADRDAWLFGLASTMRQCHALTVHAYTEAEGQIEIGMLRRLVSGALPIWATELNIGEALAPAERARRLRDWLGHLPVEAALLYHWDEATAAPLAQQGGAHYRLDLATLTALGQQPEEVPPMRDVVHDLARYRIQLGRGTWQIGKRAQTTAITLHWNGPAVVESRRRGDGALAQLRIDLEWQTRPDWPGAVGGADGLQYHAAVDADGVVWRCRDEQARLWHCGHAVGNRESLSLHLLVGRGQAVTEAQWRGATHLIEEWRSRYAIPRGRVLGHQEWTTSECPGPDVMGRLRAYRAGSPAAAVPPPDALGGRRFVVSLPAAALATVRQGPSRGHPIAGTLKPGSAIVVDAILSDELGQTIDGVAQWAHMARVPDQQADLGFVHMSALREVAA